MLDEFAMAWLIVFLRDHFTGDQEIWLLIQLAVYLIFTLLFWKIASWSGRKSAQRVTAAIARVWFALLIICATVFAIWEGAYFTYHEMEGPWLGRRHVVSSYNVRVYGDLADWQLVCVGWALNCPRREVARPSTVRLFPEKSYVSLAAFSESRGIRVIAHAHRGFSGSVICGIEEYFGVLVLWHELGHTHCHSLPPQAFAEWRTISGGFQYGYGKYDINDKSFPRDGVMSGYGAFTAGEDIAEWVMRLYARLYLGWQINIRRRDDRFLQKLHWFLKWKFITQDEYNVLEPSLR